MTTVRADDLVKAYGRSRALDGLSFTAGTGVTGLLGPNGAGKTTLLRTVATVLAPDSGRLRLLGLDPADVRERVEIRRRLGYLPQEPGFHRSFTAFEMVDYVAVLKEHVDRRARHDEVRRVLEQVGLADRMHHKPTELSGGQMQRVAVARALACDPALILADEPTGNLDTSSGHDVMGLFEGLAEQGRTLVLITHDVALARRTKRIVRIQDGLIVEDRPNAEAA